RHLWCQVAAFADIVAKIEQLRAAVFEPFDQLVLADANRPAGKSALVAVMRVKADLGSGRD
ncbi:MAG: hypothetical protein WBB95_10860, partial [Pseudomonas sp.]|uniref:hypothetical protein n=1 Tax=Pseudomonas sp. TaxID=306 RepID=UPI003C741FD5